MMKDQKTFAIKDISNLITMAGPIPRRGKDMEDIGLIENGALIVKNGFIAQVGPQEKVLKNCEGPVFSAQGRAVVPGLVDPHTHGAFAGSRWNEFEMRLEGSTYMEILQAGGGIHSTVTATRNASLEELVEKTTNTLDKMLDCGTTTVELKSGYGLDGETEIKQLKALKEAGKKWPGRTIRTFMGAHALEKKWKGKSQEFLDYLLKQVVPLVIEDDLAEFCDIFCEEGVFGLEESNYFLSACREKGLKIRLHADEIKNIGGAQLGAEIGAYSVDHLGAISPDGIKALGDSNTVATLLPATLYYLLSSKYAPAQQLIDNGAIVALASDYNPGSCPCLSMPQVMNMACIMMRMKPAQALCAATVNSAYSLGLGDKAGRIAPGLIADFLILEDEDWRILTASNGYPQINQIFVGGKPVRGTSFLK